MKINRIIPMQPVKSMPASVEFYKKPVFTIEEKNDDGGWAMLSFGDCFLMADQSIYSHQAMPHQSVLYFYHDSIK